MKGSKKNCLARYSRTHVTNTICYKLPFNKTEPQSHGVLVTVSFPWERHTPSCFLLHLPRPFCSAWSLWGSYQAITGKLFWVWQPARLKDLKRQHLKKKKNLYTKVSKALAGFVSKEKKKEKTCLPNFLVSVTKRLSDYTLRMKQPYFFMTLKKKSHFFQVPWGLGVSDFKPTAKTNPPAHIPPLLDGCKATVLTTICPFATLVTKTTYLVTILQSLKNISFRVICLFNVYFRAT